VKPFDAALVRVVLGQLWLHRYSLVSRLRAAAQLAHAASFYRPYSHIPGPRRPGWHSGQLLHIPPYQPTPRKRLICTRPPGLGEGAWRPARARNPKPSDKSTRLAAPGQLPIFLGRRTFDLDKSMTWKPRITQSCTPCSLSFVFPWVLFTESCTFSRRWPAGAPDGRSTATCLATRQSRASS